MPYIEYEDKDIVKKSIALLSNDQFITLCTVVQTWGSSPRPTGSMMLISQNGNLYGSVSGGCIEDDLLDKYNSGYFDESKISSLIYDGTTENSSIKIPCASILKIIVERIHNSDELKQIHEHLCKDIRVTRQLNLHTHHSSIETATIKSKSFSYNENYLIKTFGPQWQILVIGANHITQYVSALAKMLGYKLIICEPRENYRKTFADTENEENNQNPDSAYQITTLMPDDAVVKYANNFFNIILSLSHDPKLDDMALMAALELNLFYVGAIGSTRSCDARIQRLQSLNLSEESINKLHAPVGLDINSKTPAEIALSIFSELTRLKNNYHKNDK